jgi:hypothetical protein
VDYFKALSQHLPETIYSWNWVSKFIRILKEASMVYFKVTLPIFI